MRSISSGRLLLCDHCVGSVLSVSNFMQAKPLISTSKLEKHFTLRSMVPCDNGRLFRITHGVVRTLTYLDDGSPLVLGVWGAEDVVGSLLSSVNPYYIECFTAVEGIFFVPEDTASVAAWMKPHLQQVEELMIIRSHKTIDVKLIRLLSWLAHRFGGEGERSPIINLRMTHQDLAELAGTTRVTITRTLGHLESQGIIQRLPLGRIILREADVWYYEI
jgi:CRP-like cAMP-binding protein